MQYFSEPAKLFRWDWKGRGEHTHLATRPWPLCGVGLLMSGSQLPISGPHACISLVVVTVSDRLENMYMLIIWEGLFVVGKRLASYIELGLIQSQFHDYVAEGMRV